MRALPPELLEVVQVRADEPDPSVIARAAALLRDGQLVIYPTDTLYALGGVAHDVTAVEAVRIAKGRQEKKPVPVVVADIAQARALVRNWGPRAERLAARFWPGPLTLVLGAAPGLPAGITAGTGSVALRVPALRLPRALCAAAGPLIATSANRSRGPAPLTCHDAISGVGAFATLALDGGRGRPLASTIVDLCGPKVRLLRAGPVSWSDVRDTLRGESP